MEAKIRHILPMQKLAMFAETVKQGSITKAADKLCVTQPAVSIAIKQLEQFFGVTLIEVIGKTLHFTAGARILYRNWLEMVVSQENLLLAMESFHEGITGELRLVMVSSGKYFIPKVIHQFLQTYPNVLFSCDIKGRAYITEAMKNNIYDIAVLTDPEHDQSLSQYYLQDNPLVFIVHKDHPLAKKRSIPLEALEQVKFIMRESSALISQMLFRVFADHNLTLDVLFEMDSTEAIKQSVISGLGAALVPRFCIENELTYGVVKILKVQNISLQNKWALICSKSTEKLVLFKNFLECLTQNTL